MTEIKKRLLETALGVARLAGWGARLHRDSFRRDVHGGVGYGGVGGGRETAEPRVDPT